jgi:hypothetical protein
VEHVFVWDLRVGNLFIEALIFVDCDFTLLTVPDSSESVNNLAVQFYWMGNKLRELLDGLVNEAVSAEFTRLRQKFEDDAGTSLKVEVSSIRNLVGAATVGNPSNTLVVVLLGEDLHMI